MRSRDLSALLGETAARRTERVTALGGAPWYVQGVTGTVESRSGGVTRVRFGSIVVDVPDQQLRAVEAP